MSRPAELRGDVTIEGFDRTRARAKPSTLPGAAPVDPNMIVAAAAAQRLAGGS